jgi:hypothetical protein
MFLVSHLSHFEVIQLILSYYHFPTVIYKTSPTIHRILFVIASITFTKIVNPVLLFVI